MSAPLPLWIILAPAAFLLIDGMTAPKTSCYAGNQTYRNRADEMRTVPPQQTVRVKPIGAPV